MPWYVFIDTLNEMILHFLLVLVAQFGFDANATSFYIRPFSEFTQSTPIIVHGRLTNIHTENSITSDGARTIYTYAHLEVKELLKGDLAQKESITVRKIGGTKDGMTLEIPSSPEFKENDDTVVFLSHEKDDHTYEVLGLELGKFGLEEKNGDLVLTGGIFNYSKPGGEGSDSAHSDRTRDLAENQHPWSLSQLRTLLRNQSESANKKSANSAVSSPNPSGSPALPKDAAVKVPDPRHTEVQSSVVKMAEAPSNTQLGKFALLAAALLLAASAFLYLRRK